MSGETGMTGDMVCNACNLICEQIYLEQIVNPTSVSAVGKELTWTFKATNISGTRIIKPLVITLSYLGTLFLTDKGIDAGETLTITNTKAVEAGDVTVNPLTSVAFVSYGIPTGIPGHYNPGTRISPVVVTKVDIMQQ